MNRIILLLNILLLSVFSASTQIQSPIKWTSSVEMTSETDGKVLLNVEIENGWHLYGFNQPEGGPRSTKISFLDVSGVEFVGDIKCNINPIEKFDSIFKLNLSWWDTDLKFEQQFKINDGKSHDISIAIEYQGCNDQTCVAPSKELFTLTLADKLPKDVDYAKANDIIGTNSISETSSWWLPVEVKSSDASSQPSANQPWWKIFLFGFLGGLAALITPCVWPLIPMTVSFFLKKNKNTIIDIIFFPFFSS